LQDNPNLNATSIVNREVGPSLNYSLYDFPTIQGAAGPLAFTATGDRISDIVIMNFINETNTVKVADWSNGNLTTDTQPIFFDGTHNIPADGVQVDIVPVIIIAAVVFLVFVAFLILHKFYPKSSNSVVITAALGVGSLAVHISFLVQEYQIKNFTIFIAGIVFVSFSFLLNIVLILGFVIGSFLGTVVGDHLKKYPTHTVIAALLSSLNMESFLLISSKLLKLDGFSAQMDPIQEDVIKGFALIDTVFKTIPLLCLQILAVGEYSWTTITVISISVSIVAIAFGLLKSSIIIFTNGRVLVNGYIGRTKTFHSPSDGEHPMAQFGGQKSRE